jgi:hypothetical protein
MIQGDEVGLAEEAYPPEWAQEDDGNEAAELAALFPQYVPRTTSRVMYIHKVTLEVLNQRVAGPTRKTNRVWTSAMISSVVDRSKSRQLSE